MTTLSVYRPVVSFNTTLYGYSGTATNKGLIRMAFANTDLTSLTYTHFYIQATASRSNCITNAIETAIVYAAPVAGSISSSTSGVYPKTNPTLAGGTFPVAFVNVGTTYTDFTILSQTVDLRQYSTIEVQLYLYNTGTPLTLVASTKPLKIDLWIAYDRPIYSMEFNEDGDLNIKFYIFMAPYYILGSRLVIDVKGDDTDVIYHETLPSWTNIDTYTGAATITFDDDVNLESYDKLYIRLNFVKPDPDDSTTVVSIANCNPTILDLYTIGCEDCEECEDCPTSTKCPKCKKTSDNKILIFVLALIILAMLGYILYTRMKR